MNDPNWWVDALGVERGTAIAAFLGALFSFRMIDQALPLLSRWAMVACGFAAAIYGTPAATAWFGFKPEMTGMVGFALGLFSMSFIDAAFAAIKNGRLFEIVTRRFGP